MFTGPDSKVDKAKLEARNQSLTSGLCLLSVSRQFSHKSAQCVLVLTLQSHSALAAVLDELEMLQLRLYCIKGTAKLATC